MRRGLHLISGLLLTAFLWLSPPVVARDGPPPASPPESAAAGTATDTPGPLSPTLWEVRSKQGKAYLFGTIHMLPRGVDWFRPHVVQALDASGLLLLETIPPDSPQELAILQNRYGRMTEPKPLMTRVPAEQRPALANAINGLNPNTLEWYRTWYVALMVSAHQMQKQGFEAGLGAEAVLTARARLKKIPVAGLETAEQQITYFASIDDDEQQRLLTSSLSVVTKDENAPEKLVHMWLDGATEALATDINAEFAETPHLRTMLLGDRNQRWAADIAKRLRKSGTIFVAVGAGHFAGEHNLPDLLKRYGLKVERVREQGQAAARSR